MPGSKYERELRFIESETDRLGRRLAALRETMPKDPTEAARKAEEIMMIETQIANDLARKKEIEDSFIQAGLDVPFVGRSMNANTYAEGRIYESAIPQQEDEPVQPTREEPVATKPEATMDELTQEIESVTDELMGIEIKMLRADMNGDEDEKDKLSMMASSLRSRRDTLVARVKELKAEEESKTESPETVDVSELVQRIESLEADNRALRRQVSDLRTSLGDIREALRLMGIEVDH